MIVKLLVTGGLGLIGYHFKEVLKLSDSEKQFAEFVKALNYTKPLVGKVIKTASSETLWLVKTPGNRIDYINHQAYVNDGSKEIITIPEKIFENMLRTSNQHIGESGIYWDKEII